MQRTTVPAAVMAAVRRAPSRSLPAGNWQGLLGERSQEGPRPGLACAVPWEDTPVGCALSSRLLLGVFWFCLF